MNNKLLNTFNDNMSVQAKGILPTLLLNFTRMSLQAVDDARDLKGVAAHIGNSKTDMIQSTFVTHALLQLRILTARLMVLVKTGDSEMKRIADIVQKDIEFLKELESTLIA